MLIEPDTNSTMRNNATMIDDFPAPVLNCTSSKHRSGVEPGDLPSNDAYFFTSLDAHGEALQDKRKFGAILQDGLLDFELPIVGPRCGGFSFWNLVRWFLFEVMGVIDDTLYRIHVVLDLSKLSDHETKGLE
jgi:hypothetical protein